MSSVICIRQDVLARIIGHARREPLLECCGLLGGSNGTIVQEFAATNVAPNPAKNYEIAPEELFRLMREIRAVSLHLMGIYHSHPNGPGEPSQRDIASAFYPDAAYFILSPHPDFAAVHAFSIRNSEATELKIEPVASEG